MKEEKKIGFFDDPYKFIGLFPLALFLLFVGLYFVGEYSNIKLIMEQKNMTWEEAEVDYSHFKRRVSDFYD